MANTYSIGLVAYGPGQQLVTLPDVVAVGTPEIASAKTTPPGSVNLVGGSNAVLLDMAQATVFFPKLQDQSTGTPYVIDNERSNPAIGLIYTRPLLP